MDTINNANDKEQFSQSSTRFSWLRHIWNFFTQDSTSAQEPRIWQQSNQSGQARWCAYHPITGRSISGVTEAEIRIWLDELTF